MTFNRNEYLKKIGDIVVVTGKNVFWQKQREKYLLSESNPITTQNLRSVGNNEVVIEFDSISDDTPLERIQKETQQWANKIREVLQPYEFHQTSHNGKSPHTRLIINGLDILPYLERKLYKQIFVKNILKKIKFKSNIVKLDQGLITSKAKLVSLEEQPHFKPKWNGNVEQIIHYNKGKIFKPNTKQIEIIIKHSGRDRVQIPTIDYEDVNHRVLEEWWKEHYKLGQRNDIALALAGICRKTGLTEEQTVSLFHQLHKLTNTSDDYDTEEQYRKIVNTFAHELKDVAVYGLLGKVLTEEHLAFASQKLYSAFKKADLKLWNVSDLLQANIPPIRWHIPEMIEENGYHIVAGRPGEFKSYLTLFMAKALITGGQFLDRKVAKPCRVLYVDEESRKQRIKSRLHKMMEDVPDEFKPNLAFSIGKGAKFTHEHIQVLINDIEQFKPDVVFMDSLSRFFTGNENSSEDVKQIFSDFIKPILEKYNTAVVIIHHYNKSSDQSGGNLLRGSTELQAQIDGFLAVKKKNKNTYVISLPKTRDTESVDGLEFTVVDTDDGKLNIVYQGDVIQDNRTAQEKQADYVMKQLRSMDLGDAEFQGSIVISRIKAKGYSDQIMRKALSTLVEQDRLERIKSGWFKLINKEDLDFEEVK